LQQAQDLFGAAAAIGPLGRPLPLYYAVSQAGRAVAASRLRGDWAVRGHGLAEDNDGTDSSPGDVLSFRLRPQRRPGVFGGTAKALGLSGLTRPVELGALWAALPGVSLPVKKASWHEALPGWPQQYSQGPVLHFGAERRAHVHLRERAPNDDAAAIESLLQHYPAANGARVQIVQDIIQAQLTPWGVGVPVEWPVPSPPTPGEAVPEELLRQSDVRRVVPEYRYRREHWLVPRVGEGDDELSPLLLWWAFLFGLSLLARYEPVA
jgi:hypothetical protein